MLAVSPDETVNYIFAQRVRDLDRNVPVYVALETEDAGVTPLMVRDLDAQVLFGQARRVDAWRERLRQPDARCDVWRLNRPGERSDPLRTSARLLLPLAGTRDGEGLIMGGELKFRKGDLVTVAYYPGKEDDARAWLNAGGWVRETRDDHPPTSPAPTPPED